MLDARFRMLASVQYSAPSIESQASSAKHRVSRVERRTIAVNCVLLAVSRELHLRYECASIDFAIIVCRPRLAPEMIEIPVRKPQRWQRIRLRVAGLSSPYCPPVTAQWRLYPKNIVYHFINKRCRESDIQFIFLRMQNASYCLHGTWYPLRFLFCLRTDHNAENVVFLITANRANRCECRGAMWILR